MKKATKLTAAALAATLSLSLAACGSSASTGTASTSASADGVVYRTLDEIKADGTINIGVFSDKNPFGYVDENGEYQGYDIYFANRLAEALREKGVETVAMDLARCDMAEAVAQAFRFSKLVLATPTYNADVFPFMKEFIHHLTERNYQNRTVAFIENGSWAPMAAKVMTKMLEGSKNLTYAATTVTVRGALNAASEAQLTAGR
jgi:flavodoxin